MALKNQDQLQNALRGAKMRTQELLKTGYSEDKIYVTVVFSKGSTKVETIKKSSVATLSNLVRNAHKYLMEAGGYDNLKIDWKNEEDTVIKTQSVNFDRSGTGNTNSSAQAGSNLSGMDDGSQERGVVIAGLNGVPNTILTDADLRGVIAEHIQKHDHQKEYERLQRENQRLEGELEEHKVKNTELEKTVASKSKLEHYLGMAKDFLPGLATMFGNSPLGKTLSGLAGIGAPEEEAGDPTIADMVRDYVNQLEANQQHGVYMLFNAIEQDPTLLNRLLQNVAMQQPHPVNPAAAQQTQGQA